MKPTKCQTTDSQHIQPCSDLGRPSGTTLPLHGGNVYLPTPADLMDDEANSAAFDLLVDGGIVAIALLIIMVGVCAVMGYSWAHLAAALAL